MSLVTPSQVVVTVDRLFPGGPGGRLTVNSGFAPQLRGVRDLTRQIPGELLAMSGDLFAEFTLALGIIDQKLAQWAALGTDVHNMHFAGVPDVFGRDVVTVIRDVLAQCPDEAPPAGTAELPFIADRKIQESMRQDIGASHRAYQNAEWKAATILAGAAMEALLHWKLSEPQTPMAAADAAYRAVFSIKPTDLPPLFENWRLQQLIPVAAHLTFITAETKAQADLARDYRNLIHPGYSVRKSLLCGRDTALTALAGLEHVIRDLGRP